MRLIFWTLPVLLLLNCNGKQLKSTPGDNKPAEAPVVFYSALQLDSTKLQNFIKAEAIGARTAALMRTFYLGRNYQFAWFTPDGTAEHTYHFWNLHNSYITTFSDTAAQYRLLHQKIDAFLNQTPDAANSDTLSTELLLTKHFFEYSSNAYTGRLDPEKLQWHIPRKKLDQTALLDSFLARKGEKLEEWEPVNSYYINLRKELVRYAKIDKGGGWNEITEDGKTYRPGDSALIIQQIKYRLFVSGLYSNSDSSIYYNTELLPVLQSVQRSFGLKSDGVITTTLIRHLNIPAKTRIRQLLLNLERMRWVLEQPADEFVIVNIPEFRMHVFEGNQKQFSMDIVVGKAAHTTVIFTAALKYVVFSPYWNIPPSIVKNEIVPAMRRNRNYLARNAMEETGYANGLPVIRQKPGASNALGNVKFIFPNTYNIYFHDTPSKSLFAEEDRSFSHGCIRLAEPLKLASYLLRSQPEWDKEAMATAIGKGKERWITLKKQVPVFITYFTAWVDSEGLLNFRGDIYGHDKKLAAQLLVN